MTTIAIALEPGCTLRYRERTLDRLDDASIVIDDVAYEEIDPALTGDACSISEARRARDVDALRAARSSSSQKRDEQEQRLGLCVLPQPQPVSGAHGS